MDWIKCNYFTIMRTRIGSGAVIAAGAVANKDVPPYAIVGGIPAKIIRYRFLEDICQKLLKSHWWNIPDKELSELPMNDVTLF